MESKSIRIHDDTYLMLMELANEQKRSLVTIIEMAIEEMYLKTHPEPITIDEELARR
jgi:predicted transcriptional regulator